MVSSGVITIPIHVQLHRQVPDTVPPSARWLPPRLARAAELAGADHATLTVVLVGDDLMRRLHHRYHRLRATTDVLTFDLRDQPGDPLEADLVLCVDQARRQAAHRGHDARVELLLYAVHGLLHLLGHDDHDPRAAQRMHRREDELLTAVGVGPVFAPGKDTPNP